MYVGYHKRCPRCRRENAPFTDLQRAQRLSNQNARRARKNAARIAGPVPARVYLAIRASGPCVYCGQAAETVDHVRPLARGGAEHESNLVPACAPCNFSKGGQLLTRWRHADRVAHGVEHSPKVAAEYARLTSAEVLVPA